MKQTEKEVKEAIIDTVLGNIIGLAEEFGGEIVYKATRRYCDRVFKQNQKDKKKLSWIRSIVKKKTKKRKQ